MTSEGDRITAEAEAALAAEFDDLGIRFPKAEEAVIWYKTGPERYAVQDRWQRLADWCKEHPGQEVILDGVHANRIQRMKGRFPGLAVTGRNFRFLPKHPDSKHKNGKRVCTMRLVWPLEENVIEGDG